MSDAEIISSKDFFGTKGMVSDHVRRRRNTTDGKNQKGLVLAYALCDHPELASECDWTELDGIAWHCLLRKQPQFAVHCDWSFVDDWTGAFGRWYWATLLGEQPQFADKCDWTMLDETDLKWIVEHPPSLANKIPREKRRGRVLGLICKTGAELLADYDWSLLTGRDWCDALLEVGDAMPSAILAKCDWHLFTVRDWVKLLLSRKQYADKCDWMKLGKDEWQELLCVCPEFRPQFDKHSGLKYEDLQVDEWEPF